MKVASNELPNNDFLYSSRDVPIKVAAMKKKVLALDQAPVLVSGFHGPDGDLSRESAEWAQSDNYKTQMKVKQEFRDLLNEMEQYNYMRSGKLYNIDKEMNEMENIRSIGGQKGWYRMFRDDNEGWPSYDHRVKNMHMRKDNAALRSKQDELRAQKDARKAKAKRAEPVADLSKRMRDLEKELNVAIASGNKELLLDVEAKYNTLIKEKNQEALARGLYPDDIVANPATKEITWLDSEGRSTLPSHMVDPPSAAQAPISGGNFLTKLGRKIRAAIDSLRNIGRRSRKSGGGYRKKRRKISKKKKRKTTKKKKRKTKKKKYKKRTRRISKK